jgi:DUF1009 family protein
MTEPMPLATMPPLGIIAGAGGMPIALAAAVRASGRPVCLIGLRGIADDTITAYPHEWIKPFQAGALIRILRGAGIVDVVMAGSVTRPRLRDVAFDLTTLRFLSVLLFSRHSGDDSVMRRVTAVFEAEGFRVRSIADVAPALVAGSGALAGPRPSDAQMDDIRFGLRATDSLGLLDAGQACVVHAGRVIALEAAEGTDQMLERVASLRLSGRFRPAAPSGILIKAPKPQQELRNDMPVVGLDTIRGAIRAGLAGVAVAAGGVVLVDGDQLAREAEQAGLFVYGVDENERRT